VGHPAHAELVALTDGQLSDVDREMVESHVMVCAQCADDVADLAAMRTAIAATAHTAAVTVPARVSSGAWKFAVAAVAAAAAIFLAVEWYGPESMGDGSSPAAVQRSASTVTPTPESSAASATAAPLRERLSPEEQSIVNAALASGRVDVPANIRALGGTMGTLLGTSAPPSLSASMLPLAPSGTAVTDGTPPLSWQPIPGALSYRVAIFDQQFNEVAASAPLTTNRWTPTDELPRATTLVWQVTARLADGSDVLAPAPPQPEARFTILDAAAVAATDALRERLKDQPLALGILLAKSGLIVDAATAFDRAAADPALAAQAATLRASLKALR
jgi:hypothetical protein